MLNRIAKKILGLFSENNTDINDDFVIIVQLALEDNEIGELIRGIVYKDPSERISILDRMIKNMEMNSESQELIKAFYYLYDETIIHKLRELIK